MDTENIPIPGDDRDEERLGHGQFADEPEAAKHPTISPDSPEAEPVEEKRAETAPTVEEEGDSYVQERATARATTGTEKPMTKDHEPDGETETDDRPGIRSVSYTHLRAHETKANLVCRLLRSAPDLSLIHI